MGIWCSGGGASAVGVESSSLGSGNRLARVLDATASGPVRDLFSTAVLKDLIIRLGSSLGTLYLLSLP